MPEDRYNVIAHLAEKDGEGNETGNIVPMQYGKGVNALSMISAVSAALGLNEGAAERYTVRIVGVEIVIATDEDESRD